MNHKTYHISEEERALIYKNCGIPMFMAHNKTLPVLTLQQTTQYKQVLSNESTETTVLDSITAKPGMFAVKVTSNDMSPRFPPNTWLIVSPGGTPKNRNFVLVYVSAYSRVLFRQYLLEHDEPELVAINDAEDIIPLTYEDKIIGLVTESYYRVPR